jgi:hypothetical protein
MENGDFQLITKPKTVIFLLCCWLLLMLKMETRRGSLTGSAGRTVQHKPRQDVFPRCRVAIFVFRFVLDKENIRSYE